MLPGPITDLEFLFKPLSLALGSIGVRTTLAAAELNLVVYVFFMAAGASGVLTTLAAPEGLGIRYLSLFLAITSAGNASFTNDAFCFFGYFSLFSLSATLLNTFCIFSK